MSDVAFGARHHPVVVTLTGPESTGKTTLAAAIASRYGAALSLEAARAYADARRAALGPDAAAAEILDRDDVAPIARAQIAGETAAAERAAQAAATVLVRDTDLVSTVVYARHYYGECPAWVVDAARCRLANAYLLCDVDVPWIADGQRDRPTERAALRDAFARTLEEFGCHWSIIAGDWPAREAAAAAAIEAIIADRVRRASMTEG